MHSRKLARLLPRVYLGLLALFGLLSASHVLAGEGYIFIFTPNVGIRPLLFFSDTSSMTFPEWGGKPVILASVDRRIYPVSSGDISVNISGLGTFTGTDGGGWSWTLDSGFRNFRGIQYPSSGLDAQGYRFIDFSSYPNELLGTVYSFGIGVRNYFFAGIKGDNLLNKSRYHMAVTSSSSYDPDWQFPVNAHDVGQNYKVAIYRIPPSLGLTLEILNGQPPLPWGWWGDTSRFTWDSNYNVVSINTGSGDNPAFPPEIPINPLTGSPYSAGTGGWNWNPDINKWVWYNKWMDATSVPSVPLGPTGQWVYGRNPKGNVHNPDPEGNEWWWDGTYFGEVNLPGSGSESDPWNGQPSTGQIDSSTLALLTAIEQNTRATKAELLGYQSWFGTRVDGVRDAVIEARTTLFSCLDGHHKWLEPQVVTTVSKLTSIEQYQSEIVASLASGFGGVSGALSGMGGTLDQIAVNTAQQVAKQEAINDNLVSGMSNISGGLQSIESRVSSAVDGLTRLEGQLIDLNQMSSFQYDQWASYITAFEDGQDQSIDRLQYICDVADTLKDQGLISEENAIWWRVERIRWVERDEEKNVILSDSNDKLSELINTVASIPPPEIPEVNLSSVESTLQQIASGQATGNSTGSGILSGIGGLSSDLAQIKARLASIDNVLSARMDAAELGELQLHPVQQQVKNDLEGYVKGVHDRFNSFESSTSSKWAFGGLGVGRVANPAWFSSQLSWGVLEYDLTLDWSDSRWNFIQTYRPLWILLERWALWMMCLYHCYRALIEV